MGLGGWGEWEEEAREIRSERAVERGVLGGRWGVRRERSEGERDVRRGSRSGVKIDSIPRDSKPDGRVMAPCFVYRVVGVRFEGSVDLGRWAWVGRDSSSDEAIEIDSTEAMSFSLSCSSIMFSIIVFVPSRICLFLAYFL